MGCEATSQEHLRSAEDGEEDSSSGVPLPRSSDFWIPCAESTRRAAEERKFVTG